MQLEFSRTSRKVLEHMFRKTGRAQINGLEHEMEEPRKDARVGL